MYCFEYYIPNSHITFFRNYFILLNSLPVYFQTVIVTQNMIASRLPQYLKDPSEFKPERWIRNSPEYEHIHPFLSLPFGFGSRACIARHLAEQNISITLMRVRKNAFNLIV